MSVYLIAQMQVHSSEGMAEYARLSRPLAEQHGGRYLVRGGEVSAVEGGWDPQRLAVIEFPDRESAQAFLDDPAYQQVAQLRRSAASAQSVLVAGIDAS